MLSPFLGMDPYIEQSKIGVDFHNRLADQISAELNTQIRPGYFARLTPYTTYDAIEAAETRVQAIRPDVGVMQRPALHPEPHPRATAVVAVETPSVTSKVLLDAELELLSV